MSDPEQETLTTDRLDWQLIHALLIDGRATFRRIAEVLDTSEQTIARRYRRLREAGAIRVVVLPDPRRFEHNWIVRAKVRPPTAVAFAEAIARRGDVAWVGLTASGSEVTFAARARTARQRDTLLLERLPHSRQVLDLSTVAVLHHFVGDPATEWHAMPHRLDDAQVATLAHSRRHDGPGAQPTEVDRPLLDALALDGRATYTALAAHTGDTEAHVARRVGALLSGGAVMVNVELAGALLGFPVNAWLWLSVAPAHVDAVGHAIARHPEIPFACATSGAASLGASVIAPSTAALYRYVTDRLGAIDAIHALEVVPILRRLKQAGTLLEGPRLPAPV